jgi:spore maturation protein SpmB
VYAAFAGRMQAVSDAIFESARTRVELVIGLTGIVVFGVRICESAAAGDRQGLERAVRILPCLLAILVAVGMFRASGALDPACHLSCG